MMKKQRTKYIHIGQFAAEVDVELVEGEKGWAPYLTLEDAKKLDNVREALKNSDIEKACRYARVYTLTPIAA